MTEWRKSSRSGTGTQSDCVELAHLPGSVGVRDSKDPDGAAFAISLDAFRALVRDAKAGDLDTP